MTSGNPAGVCAQLSRIFVLFLKIDFPDPDPAALCPGLHQGQPSGLSLLGAIGDGHASPSIAFSLDQQAAGCLPGEAQHGLPFVRKVLPVACEACISKEYGITTEELRDTMKDHFGLIPCPGI